MISSTDVWTDKGRTRHALKGFTQQKCLTINPQQLYYIVYVQFDTYSTWHIVKHN